VIEPIDGGPIEQYCQAMGYSLQKFLYDLENREPHAVRVFLREQERAGIRELKEITPMLPAPEVRPEKETIQEELEEDVFEKYDLRDPLEKLTDEDFASIRQFLRVLQSHNAFVMAEPRSSQGDGPWVSVFHEEFQNWVRDEEGYIEKWRGVPLKKRFAWRFWKNNGFHCCGDCNNEDMSACQNRTRRVEVDEFIDGYHNYCHLHRARNEDAA
jgi:hypothetical protein